MVLPSGEVLFNFAGGSGEDVFFSPLLVPRMGKLPKNPLMVLEMKIIHHDVMKVRRPTDGRLPLSTFILDHPQDCIDAPPKLHPDR